VLASGLVEVFDSSSGQLLVEARVANAVLVELGHDGHLVVVDRHGPRAELDPSGLACRVQECLPGEPIPAAPDLSPPPPAGASAGTAGFCLEGRGCFDWRGAQIPDADLAGGADAYVRQGQFLSLALDSGLPGCRWHRIRVDADRPEGTALEAAFATTDGPPHGRPPGTRAPGAWAGFPAGDPHSLDWYEVAAGSADSTLTAPPGRYGYLRLRLSGDGQRTPSVYQVRLDLPRATSVDSLPAAYSDDPAARDFTERFVSLFDAQLEEIDEALARRPALLDAESLPDDALGWLAGLLGTGIEAEMDVPRRRELLRSAPELFRSRGTIAGLIGVLRIVPGVTAGIEELGTARPWGAVGTASVGGVRLFGRSRVRVRLGTSRLGQSRLESGGNPDHDAIRFGESRIRVHVPAGTDAALASRVVRSQVPAHVIAEVRVAPAGSVATVLRLGIDTVLQPPDPAVVGGTTLGRRGLVGVGRGAAAERVVGRPAAAAARQS
jgi:phage tail-like protein